jgi:hypothetical protein
MFYRVDDFLSCADILATDWTLFDGPTTGWCPKCSDYAAETDHLRARAHKAERELAENHEDWLTALSIIRGTVGKVATLEVMGAWVERRDLFLKRVLR